MNQYNINFEFSNEEIVISDFNKDYNAFIIFLNKISFDEVEQVMLFKCFNEYNDIVVSYSGDDYIISKEYFDILDLKK